MSLIDYNLALYYALETYGRRDLIYVMSRIYGKKGKKGKDTFGFKIEQPEIEEWVAKQYEKESD